MTATPVTSASFEQLIKDNPILIVDFWAPWCGPCRTFKPIFEAAAERHTDIAFAACNTEEEQDLAGALGIRSIPTLMVFKQGVLVFNQPGMLPAPVLDELVGKVKELDMDAVRAQIASAGQSVARAAAD